MIWIFSILGDRAASLDIKWNHWPCNIDITKNRFYMAARIDKIVISKLAATDLAPSPLRPLPPPSLCGSQIRCLPSLLRIHLRHSIFSRVLGGGGGGDNGGDGGQPGGSAVAAAAFFQLGGGLAAAARWQPGKAVKLMW